MTRVGVIGGCCQLIEALQRSINRSASVSGSSKACGVSVKRQSGHAKRRWKKGAKA